MTLSSGFIVRHPPLFSDYSMKSLSLPIITFRTGFLIITMGFSVLLLWVSVFAGMLLCQGAILSLCHMTNPAHTIVRQKQENSP